MIPREFGDFDGRVFVYFAAHQAASSWRGASPTVVSRRAAAFGKEARVRGSNSPCRRLGERVRTLFRGISPVGFQVLSENFTVHLMDYSARFSLKFQYAVLP